MDTTNNPLLIRSTSPAEFGRALAARRRDQPVYFDDNLRSWVILDQQAIQTALHNPEVFSSSYQKEGPFGETFVALDGPEHLKLRRIYARAFSPRALKTYEDTVITPCAQRISARIAQKARCDLIDEFCFPLPMDIISALVGIKAEDVYVTKDWIKTLVLWAANHHKPEFVAQGKEALRRCIEHLRPSVDDVLENPREGNILSQLVEAHREQAAALDHDAILNLAAGLLVAGYETTSWTLAGTLAALLLHPDSLARIRHDRSLLMPAVEEAMRWCSSVVVLPRVVLAETVVCDRTITAGSVVMLCFSSSHYDEALHANPEVYAIDRNPEHLNFGGGPHSCLGAPLARMEARIGLSALLDSAPHVRLDPAERPMFLLGAQGSAMYGPDSLRVLLSPDPAA